MSSTNRQCPALEQAPAGPERETVVPVEGELEVVALGEADEETLARLREAGSDPLPSSGRELMRVQALEGEDTTATLRRVKPRLLQGRGWYLIQL